MCFFLVLFKQVRREFVDSRLVVVPLFYIYSCPETRKLCTLKNGQRNGPLLTFSLNFFMNLIRKLFFFFVFFTICENSIKKIIKSFVG